jgi:AbrB family looped-hinge helix DNA binding protein
MSVATVSSKGQITLPAEARRRLGIHVCDRVSIDAHDREIVIRRIESLLELKGFAGKSCSATDERTAMMDAVADRVAGKRR